MQCAQPAAAQEDDAIVARVDGKPIYYRRVKQEVAKALNGRPTSPAEKKQLQSQAMEQLIGRRLVLLSLASMKMAATESELRLARERAINKLKTQELTLDEFLTRSNLTEEDFQEMLAWQIGWQRYLDRYLTDQNLERYFNQHPRDFNGAQIEVAHLLLKMPPDAQVAPWEQAIERAQQIKAAIDSKQQTFAEAARQFSQAPTAKQGGNIGLISRREPMPESFSKAAFALQPGEVSEPVATAVGVHLIHCIKITPGQRKWTDAKKELKPAVMRYLFRFVANGRRQHAKIEYTGVVAQTE